MNNKEYWVYILVCDNQSYYTGYTDDLVKRYKSHLNGSGSKYTRSFKPLKIAQCWRVQGSKSLAMQLERDIKRCSRKQKSDYILHPETVSNNPCIIPGQAPLELEIITCKN